MVVAIFGKLKMESRGVQSGSRVSFERLLIRCVLRRVTFESGRLVTVQLKISYLSYRVCIISVSIEIRVKRQLVSGCYRLTIGSVLSGTDRIRVFFQVEFGYELLITID